MTLVKIENHKEISDRFLHDARCELERGDLPQASEKAWEAVEHYLKSVAKSRNWRGESHLDLIHVGGDLALETDDPSRARLLLAVARDMRVNTYEDWLPDSAVAVGIDAADELISRLEARIGPEIHPRPSQAPRPPIR